MSTSATITMYGLTAQLNERGAKALGDDWKPVREQHLYNYRKNGMIKVSDNGRVTQHQADEFINAFVGRRKERLAKPETVASNS
jgi:hypothetical protein